MNNKPEPKKPAGKIAVAPTKQSSSELLNKLQSLNLRRVEPDKKPRMGIKKDEENPEITRGTIDRILDVAFNASKDKMREVTVVDRMQGRLLPLLDVINVSWNYILEVSAYRFDKEAFAEIFEADRPAEPNLIEEYIYRICQWQKSVAGLNLNKAIDLALAEMETKADDQEAISGGGFEN